MKKKFFFALCVSTIIFLEFENNTNANNYFEKNIYVNNYSSFNSPLSIKEEIKPPLLITNLLSKNISSVEYNATPLSREKNNVNYLVFYKENENNELIEIYRIMIEKSGNGKITDEKLLKKLTTNSKIFVSVECINFSKGKIEKKLELKNQTPYYLPKEYNINVYEDGKLVDSSTNFEQNKIIDGIQQVPLKKLQNYKNDKFYSYDDAVIKANEKTLQKIDDNILVPYNISEININLAKDLKNWKKVLLQSPILEEKNRELLAKDGEVFSDFIRRNSEIFTNINKDRDNYIFDGYYVEDTHINKYNKNITKDIIINEKYYTKIVLKADDVEEEFLLLTGQNLVELPIKKYEKKYYDIASYTIIDNETSKKKIVDTLDDILVDKSITIELNYKEQKNTLKIRQDDYNSRFGKVSEEIREKDIQYPKNKPAQKLLEELRKNITPDKGYEVLFRVNKNIIGDDYLFNDDDVVEIYFKKIAEDWVNVKFIGEGIDKFLSDGQEVLHSEKLDNINLPTSNGVDKEFLGWRANRNYKILKNNKIIQKTPDSLLSLSDISSILTTKGENLIFTAEYMKTFNVDVDTNINGTVLLPNNQKSIKVKENSTIKETLENKKIIMLPKSHYKFSHLTSTLPVIVKTDKGETRLVNIGEKISLSEFYSIQPESNLTFYANFKFSSTVDNVDEFLKNREVVAIMDIEQFETESNKNLAEILGPFNYLR